MVEDRWIEGRKGRRTINELEEMLLGYGLATTEAYFDVVSMPVGAEVRALVFDVDKGGTETDVASARARCRLGGGSGRFDARRRGGIGWVREDISRNEGIEEFLRERK